MSKKRSRHIGSSLDDFLKEEGVLDQFRAIAAAEVREWTIAQKRAQRISGGVTRSAAFAGELAASGGGSVRQAAVAASKVLRSKKSAATTAASAANLKTSKSAKSAAASSVTRRKK